MKKILFLSVMLMGTVAAKAQLMVNSSGNVGIGANASNVYSLNVRSDVNQRILEIVNNRPSGVNYGIYTTLSQSDNNAGSYGIRTNSYAKGSGGHSYGLYSFASSKANGYSIAVFGKGDNVTSINPGNCYGVIGTIGASCSGYGVGVFGSNNGGWGITLDKKYAGYFAGPVKVQGDLTVTGTINGIVLSPSSSPSPGNMVSQEEETNRMELTSLLCGLSTSTYYVDMPQSKVASLQSATLEERTNADITGVRDENEEESDEDAIYKEYKDEVSKLEAQVYSKKHYGLSVEQLETTFPDLVYENEDGSKCINYMEMVPILVQAINELKAEIMTLKGNASAETKSQTTAMSGTVEDVTILSLGQNKPNPFGKATSIAVSVPEDVRTAFLYVYNLNGNKVAQVDISARGTSSVTLSASNLSDGMYLYSLIVDGKVVETRRMIVEK